MWRRVWIWERKLKKGKAYCLRWHDETGRIRTETVGPGRKLAERKRTEREQEVNAGSFKVPPRITYADFIAEEVEVMQGQMAPASLKELELVLRQFGKVCGDTKLTSISSRLVEQFFAQRLKSAKPATANKSLRTLKAALNRAVRRGYLQRNPVVGLKPVREPEREVRVLTAEEIGKLLEACPSPRWRALVAVAVTTGMRLGELLNLTWDDVDLDGGLIRVRNKPGHPTKSRRNRVLALVPEVGEMLRRLASREGQLFHTCDGQPVRNNLQRDFQAVVKRAGIARCTFHDLRRTFVSHLAMAGVNEALVQQLAGHTSIATTLKYYTGIMPEALRAAQVQLPYMRVLKDISDTYHEPLRLVRRKSA